jgi:hypothetical protein
MNHNPVTFHTAHQKRWTVRESRRRSALRWEIVDHHHDTIAVVYGDKAEAELLASAPQQHVAAQELRTCTRRLAAILEQFQERLMPSEREALDRARDVALR